MKRQRTTTRGILEYYADSADGFASGEETTEDGGDAEEGSEPGLCPIALGREVLSTPPESMPQLRKKLLNSTQASLKIDTTTLRVLGKKSVSDAVNTMITGMIGLSALMEVVHEKSTAKAVDGETVGTHNLQASFNPASVMMRQPVYLTGIHGEQVNLTDVFGRILPKIGSLRSIVHEFANEWMSEIMTFEERRKFTTSRRPQAPQVPLPAHLLNVPLAMLIESITITGGIDERKKNVTIGSLFQSHFTYLFNYSRHIVARGRKEPATKHRTVGTCSQVN